MVLKTIAKFSLGICFILCLSSCKNDTSAQNQDQTSVEEKVNNKALDSRPVNTPKTKKPISAVRPAQKSSSGSGMEDYLSQQKEILNLSDIYPYNLELKDAAGTLFNTEDILDEGKPTVLLFWLTTCGPCQMELREITKKYEGWQEEADFNFYAISTDFEKNYERFSKQVQDKKYPWPTYNDVHRRFRYVMPGGLNGLPQSFVLNKKGEIVYHKRKYRMGDEDKLFDTVKSLL